MNVLSLFNGLGGVWIALDKLNVKVNKRYSSEIDKYANQVNDANYPDTIQLGDITAWHFWNIEKPDLIIGGFPCQAFSNAGKQLGFADIRGQLLYYMLEVIKYYRPKYFILENVKGILSKKFKPVIDLIYQELESYGYKVQHNLINSALVSAQNRNRVYFTNFDISQPEDKGILLKDILQPEGEVDKKYYLKNKDILRGYEQAKGKIWKSGNRMGNMDFPTNIDGKSKTLTVVQTIGGRETNHIVKLDKKGNKKSDQNKASCLTGGAHSGGNHSDMDIICVAMRGRNPDNPSDRTAGIKTEQRLEPKTDGKTNTLTSVQKDNLIMKMEKTNTLTPDAYLATGKRKRDADGKDVLTSMHERRLRRLTPIECERLQTVPDNYTNHVSNSQRYKMLGNGFTINVISHILNGLKT